MLFVHVCIWPCVRIQQHNAILPCICMHDVSDMFLYRYVTAVCDCACQNGGSCTSPGVCTCDYGWTGRCCETREFCVHSPAKQ